MTNTVGVAVTSVTLPSNLTWRGDGTADIWNTSAANWFDGTNLVAFKGGDTVTFDDTGSNNPAISLGGPGRPAGMIIRAGQNYPPPGNSAVSGSMSRTKSRAR